MKVTGLLETHLARSHRRASPGGFHCSPASTSLHTGPADGERGGGGEAFPRGDAPPPVAVLGFHSTASEEAALRKAFGQFAYSDKTLFLFPAEREGELYTLSKEVGERLVACIHADYEYSATYLAELTAGGAQPDDHAIWTLDSLQCPGPRGDGTNPDLYRSLVPAEVFRVVYSVENRHIAMTNRNKLSRGLHVHVCPGTPVATNGALPNPLHQLNGLYWLVDYAHRMDRRCILAYLDLKGIDTSALGQDHQAFLATLTPIQYRHLLFFLNANVVGERGVGYVSSHIDLSAVDAALDVGSGYGGLVKALCARGCKATGIECMQGLMDVAEINLAGHDAELIVGDFLKHDLAPACYDLLTMTDVIEHVADAELAISRATAVLREGGYIYIKIPNYRFIDYVREDSHTGLFAITLLRHDAAAAYLRAVRDMRYSVGDYYDYDDYIAMFEKHGATLVRAENIESPPGDTAKLLAGCRDAFGRWQAEGRIDPAMREEIHARVVDYLAEFERMWRSHQDSAFQRDYMTSHWNMFFQKRPAR